jgi:16S rRNA (guanine527-N7)-methyltransferase
LNQSSVSDTDRGAADVPQSGALEQALEESRSAGFLGPGPISTHLAHARGFLRLARQLSADVATPHLLDLGSGGGVPGLVIACDWDSPTLVLLDAMERRTTFLRRAVSSCGLDDRVTVVQDRAERFGRIPEHRGAFDGVVVRSFGPPAVVAECAAPMLRTGGWLIVSEPPVGAQDPRDPSAAPEAVQGLSAGGGPGGKVSPSRWPREGLAAFGLEPVEYVQEGFGYQILRRTEPCPERFPRRDGVPARKPLF